ncbi:site-specific integrase [Rhodanobacter sp. AS-Z3]|uniref:site-specific integrase n=1 Tax=Rhodanobacter sp. AS-Z3 TaxID=3031330 RepID=UPI002478C059|nr:site-specific integrase [Rhodanobacter sp. AS-Z3]WEN13659.1 site-specific integrase [Rhodanobacter sp. AS-Z3]
MKRRRGDAWHYTVKRAGLLPRPLYLSFTDEAEGDEYVRRVEALLDRGVVPDEFGAKRELRPTLRDGVRRYLAGQHVAADDPKVLGVVLQRLPMDMRLAELSFTWATRWVGELKRKQNLAPSTIRKHVGALSRCLDWLAGHGDVPFNALRSLPKGYASYTPDDAAAVAQVEGVAKDDVERDRRLELGEEARIRAVLDGMRPDDRQRALELREADALRLLFEMALESAMRMREMFTLSVDQVDLKRRTIFLDKTKNGSKRQVPITTVLRTQLAVRLKSAEPGELVFPWWDGDARLPSLRRTTSLLSRQFARVFSAAKCEGLHFHDLRHEATSRLFERTKLSDLEIAKITGHKSLAQLARYANLRGSNLAARLW